MPNPIITIKPAPGVEGNKLQLSPELIAEINKKLLDMKDHQLQPGQQVDLSQGAAWYIAYKTSS